MQSCRPEVTPKNRCKAGMAEPVGVAENRPLESRSMRISDEVRLERSGQADGELWSSMAGLWRCEAAHRLKMTT